MPMRRMAMGDIRHFSVVDEQSVPIPFANIAIFQSTDSVMISGVVTGEKGFFTAQLTPKTYYLKITFPSYEEEIVSNLELTDKDIDVGAIALHISSKRCCRRHERTGAPRQ